MRSRLLAGMVACVFAVVLHAPAVHAAFTLVQTFTGSFPMEFGFQVAPVGLDRVLVTAPFYCSGGSFCSGSPASGAGFLVGVDGGAVVESFFNPTPGMLDMFGFSAAVSGNRVILGAMLDDDSGAENAGSVYVFNTLTGDLVQTITRPQPLAGGYFGYALAADSAHLLIGGYRGGTVYLVDAATFAVGQTYVDPIPTGDSKSFGQAVALSSDLVVVGEPEGNIASTPETGLWPGTAHVYERSTGVLRYTLEPPTATASGFGTAVLIDGPRLLVTQTGGPAQVNVYDLATGVLQQTIPSPDVTPGIYFYFGNSLAVLGDRVIVGAPAANDLAGTVFVIDRTTGDLLQAIANPSAESLQAFGYSVAIVGNSILTGAGVPENPTAPVSGSAFVFAACGDGANDAGEQCDDGNVVTGDGCSATCQYEAPPSTTSTSMSMTTTTAFGTTSTTTQSTNLPPVAVAGRNRVVAIGQTVSLDGGASFDVDDDVLTFEWIVLSRPAGSSASLIDAATPTPSITTDVVGTYVVQLIVSDGQHSSEPSMLRLTAVQSPPAVSIIITDPPPAASIASDRTIVKGTVQGPPNVGVSVNGMTAVVSGTSFAATVPLHTGTNILTAIAAVPAGDVVQTAVAVDRNGAASPIDFEAVPTRGLAPLLVSFDYAMRTPNRVQTLRVDFDGDGTNDLVTSDPGMPLSWTYELPGLYFARIEVVMDQGEMAAQSVPVAVEDMATTVAMLTDAWSSMTNALASSSLETALGFFDEGVRAGYERAFTDINGTRAAFVESLSPLGVMQVGANIAECWVTRGAPGSMHLFFIYFVRGSDGVWRINTM